MSEGWNWTRLDDKFTCLRVAGYCLDASVTRCAGSFVFLLSLQEFGTCAREVHRSIRTHILWICCALLETFWNFIREYNMIMGKFIMVNIYILATLEINTKPCIQISSYLVSFCLIDIQYIGEPGYLVESYLTSIICLKQLFMAFINFLINICLQ